MIILFFVSISDVLILCQASYDKQMLNKNIGKLVKILNVFSTIWPEIYLVFSLMNRKKNIHPSSKNSNSNHHFILFNSSYNT